MNAPATVTAVLAVCIAIFSNTAHAQLPKPPLAKTQTAAPVRATTATLNGMALPNRNPTSAWFEWGTERTYGNATPPQDMGSGARVVRISAPLDGLTEGGVYHYRLVASNALGVVNGFDFMFTTAMEVQNWGSFSSGRPAVPSGLTNLAAVACGHGHCLALRNDGSPVAWMVGFTYPNYGQTNIPPGLSNLVALAGGFSHCLALKDDTTVVAWGKYADGRAPDPPPGLTNAIAIAGGDYFSAALKADGTVATWGENFYPNTTNVPSNLSNVVAISCGTGHTLALKADGTVAVWGGDIGAVQPPASATNLVAVATMGWWNLALRGDGSLVTWGQPFDTNVPPPLDLTNAAAIVTGYAYAEVLRADGTLVGWGRPQDATNIPPQLSNVVTFASGDYHRIGLAQINLPPKSFPRSVSGPTNTALTISLAPGFFDANGDLLTGRIASLPTNGLLYQYTAAGPGDPINTPGTLLTDPSRVIFVPQPGTMGSPYDTFGVVANDGQADSSPAPCTVSIVPPPLIQSALVTTAQAPAFVLAFSGLSNASYSAWQSTLGAWTYLGRATQSAPGQFLYADTSFTNAPIRFYRISSP